MVGGTAQVVEHLLSKLMAQQQEKEGPSFRPKPREEILTLVLDPEGKSCLWRLLSYMTTSHQ
jgi:hypothetical protein